MSSAKTCCQITDVTFGKDVVVIEPSSLIACTLADGVFVGPFVAIAHGVCVGAHTRIQSHSLIREYVEIGSNCFIGHGVVFVGNGFASGELSQKRHAVVGNNVSIGSNATILPVRICDGCVIGAGAVLTKDALTRGIYAGNPARLLRSLG
ncbi:MAG: N-acetyltransferase [Helicobacter sp.]|nr:N-acetyltransferase [Helicobacter sp.]